MVEFFFPNWIPGRIHDRAIFPHITFKFFFFRFSMLSPPCGGCGCRQRIMRQLLVVLDMPLLCIGTYQKNQRYLNVSPSNSYF